MLMKTWGSLLPILLQSSFLEAQEDQSSAPVSSAPVVSTTAPVQRFTRSPTQAPISSAPVTPAPITPALITPVPVTATPITAVPITSGPVTSEPVSQAPVTKTPISSAPVSGAPASQAPITNPPVTIAPVIPEPDRLTLAKEDFDGGTLGLISGFNATRGNLDGGRNDWFGVASLGAWPQSIGAPLGLVDTSVASVGGARLIPGDSEGIFGQNRDADDRFFSMSDIREFGTSATASWTFNIDLLSSLLLSIDMGGIANNIFGGYDADTEIRFTAQVDDGPIQTAFIVTAVENDGSFSTRLMDDGGTSGGGRLLFVSGDNDVFKTLVDGSRADNLFLDKSPADGPYAGKLDKFSTKITQASSGLVLKLNLVAELKQEAFAFDNIVISGSPNKEGTDEVSIMQIQGESQMSPLLGQRVSTSGIVTAISSDGFYLQDPFGDDIIATSDAIYIFSGSRTLDVSIGDMVKVTGTVHELERSTNGELSRTELRVDEHIIMSSGNVLPEPVIIGLSGRIPPTNTIDGDPASFDPINDGVDFYESMESMLVTIQDAVAVSPTNRNGEIFAVVNQGVNATGISTRGTLNIAPDDFNPEKIQIDMEASILDFNIPRVSVGALLGDVTGLLSYSYSNFEVIPTQDFTSSIVPSSLEPDATTFVGGINQLTVASYDLNNLDPNDSDGDRDISDGRFSSIASQIVNNLLSPDIIALQGVQDNSGMVDDGEIAADGALQILVDEILVFNGPRYEFIDNDFISDNSSGGSRGSNIRCAFLFNPRRVGVDLVRPILGEAFVGGRIPLAADFTFNSGLVTVISSHFSSKGGSAPVFGTKQPIETLQEDPEVNGGIANRKAETKAIIDFVEEVRVNNTEANIIVLGDFNDYEFNSPITNMESANLTNLMNNLPENERYTYIFEGSSMAIDHIFVSDSLAEDASFDVVHVNSEFESTSRASSHDPIIATVTIGLPFVTCFDGEATVQVEHKGVVKMNNLSLGDKVLVAGGKFSEVYSFGHLNYDFATKFLSIDSGLNRPLVLSADHMVFVKGVAVPASNVLIGDELSLVDGTSVFVKSISMVTGVGAFAPFTRDGTIVVDNIVASSYVSLQTYSEKLVIGATKILNWHDLAHISQAPHRVICTVNPAFCASSELYNNLGISIWVEQPLKFTKWAVDKKPIVTILLLLPLLLALLTVLVLEIFLIKPALLYSVILGMVIYKRLKVKKEFKS